MATLSKNNIALNDEWMLVTLPEAASQSFEPLDPVILSSNKVAIAAAADADISNSVVWIGFAAEAASGTTSADVKVWIPKNEGAWFRTAIDHGTAASAITAYAQLGTNYCATNSATGGTVIAYDNTTNPSCKVMAIDPNFALGEQYGWVWARILTSVNTYVFA